MKYFLILWLIIFSPILSTAQSAHTMSITISPLHLKLPVVEITAEFLTKKGGSLAGIIGAGTYNDVSLIEVGGQYNYYLLGSFEHGLHIGAEAMGMYGWADVYNPYTYSNSTEVSAFVMSIGPYAGYKFIAEYGFTLVAQGGKYFATGSGLGETSSTSAFFVNLNAGWSF